MSKEKTLEHAFEELDHIIKQLEDKDISLEDSFQIYHDGMKLLKFCNDKIDKVEKKMMSISEDGELYEF